VSSELTRRVAFAVIAVPVGIAIVLYGGAPLAALLAIISALGAWELFRLARAGGSAPMDDAGVALAGLLPLLVHARFLRLYDPESAVGALSLASLVLLVLIASAIWARGVTGKPLAAVAVTALGIAYTGGMLSFGYAIRYHDYAFAPANLALGARTFSIPSGALLLLLPMFITWASDTGAYAVGKVIGRHKLAPAVSPGKTIEGAIGALVASVIVGWAYSRWILRPSAHLDFRWAPAGAILFSLAVSVSGQIGDLAESLFKREVGAKDSSHLIPGHGGILDRFDSLLFALPLSYVLFSWLLTWAPA
jgi:phosphatidate cytidylyltransferase